MAGLFWALLVAVAVAVRAASNGDAAIPLWPLPKKVQLGSTSITLNQNFRFDASKAYFGQLSKEAVQRYEQLIGHSSSTDGALEVCKLSVASSTIPEIIGADETYSVSVDANGQCSISANTYWGLLRGLETFTQLLVRDGQAVALHSAPATVEDSARYGHRGLLIDSSRHYLSFSEIKRIVDSLPYNKFNVLHWHAVDAESFPLDTPSEPDMIKGAYNNKMIYSMSQLSELRDYAYSRGVEVILEIDVPGHAAAWNDGKPELMAQCMEKYWYNINDFALNPSLEATYSTISNILRDTTTALKSSRVHLGGDEVVYGCWSNDTSIVSFMNTQGYTSYSQLLSYFADRVDSIVLNDLKQSTVIHWEEVFTAGYKPKHPEKTLFQVWTDSSKVQAITAAGYRLIAAPSNYWYLNIATNTWTSMYNYDPTMDIPTDQQSLIVGGETALWGEYVDESNIEVSIYPRAMSVAERLWSDKAQTADSTLALDRLLVQRCRLVNRGIHSAPVQPAGYCNQTYV